MLIVLLGDLRGCAALDLNDLTAFTAQIYIYSKMLDLMPLTFFRYITITREASKHIGKGEQTVHNWPQ